MCNNSLPEYAFIGRSNVGKSSLINLIINKKNLAKTSSFPGKTTSINNYLINNKCIIVDLPGYGYYRRSKLMKNNFLKIIKFYIINTKNLICLFQLIDIRIPPQKKDLNFIKWLYKKKIFFCIIFTKIDKISNFVLNKNIFFYKKKIYKKYNYLNRFFKTSIKKKKYKINIINYINKLNFFFNKEN
ncbi:ribosome biogenesis GTP-binding protein YihA/YsxC [Candidatus Karelsulcia muelleri]|uniref:ribosome biogenesis GTP-binding protein YihA/YsxC n=1 Tax=Candidatus Karelsulcia muelleri TaxID=336810 RepID=UPI0035C92BBD